METLLRKLVRGEPWDFIAEKIDEHVNMAVHNASYPRGTQTTPSTITLEHLGELKD